MYEMLFFCCSAGKSFVAEILMLRRVITTGKMAILVLPYVSICTEKVLSFVLFSVNFFFFVCCGSCSWIQLKIFEKTSIHLIFIVILIHAGRTS